MQRDLGEQYEGVGLLLRKRGRFRGNVLHIGGCTGGAPPLVEGLAGGLESTEEERARFRSEAAAHGHRAVVVLKDVQRASRVLSRGLAHLRLPINPTPAAHDPLDVLGGAGARECEEALLGLGRGDTRDRPDLRIGDLGSRQRGGKPGQGRERARHADTLPRRAEVEPYTPAQPRGARAEPVVPARVEVELADAVEQARGGRFQMRRELRDLIAQTGHHFSLPPGRTPGSARGRRRGRGVFDRTRPLSECDSKSCQAES
jgi:hypothetical protein